MKTEHQLAEITARTPSGFSERFKCGCGKEHRLSPYVFAHWRDTLQHTCNNCGRVNKVQNGVIETPVRPPYRTISGAGKAHEDEPRLL